MHIKPIYILHLLFIVLLFLGCTNKSKNTSSNNESTHLTIGVMSSMDYLPLAVAQQNGLFEEEGVNITIHKFYSANERDAAFQSNNLDGTIIELID